MTSKENATCKNKTVFHSKALLPFKQYMRK